MSDIMRPGTRYVLRRVVPPEARTALPDVVYCATLVDIHHALQQWFPGGPLAWYLNDTATAVEIMDPDEGITMAVLTEVFQ